MTGDIRLERALATEGWMSPVELQWLAETAKNNQVIFEVGCLRGRTTRALGDNCSGMIFAIDPFKGDYFCDNGQFHDHFGEDVYHQFLSSVKDLIKNFKVIHLRTTLPELIRKPEKIQEPDFIFLDGDHRYPVVKEDIQISKRFIKPGGIIAGHDYDNQTWPGVKQAVNEEFEHVELVETIWWVKV